MNLLEKWKYYHRYSALNIENKAKAELYIFDKYQFAKHHLPIDIADAYNEQQNWLKTLNAKPNGRSDIYVEYKKWILIHFDNVSKLADFDFRYKALADLYTKYKEGEYYDEIVQLCAEKTIDIDNPSYSELLLLTDADKLANMRIDNQYTKSVLQNELRASYVDKYIKDNGNPPISKEYIVQHLDNFDKYILKCKNDEKREALKELKRRYPDGMEAFDKEHRYNLYYSLEHVEEIKALDVAEKKRHKGSQSNC
jgi:hypothetical protein